ncbi:flagellar motor protein MotA [Enterovirga aerilata]|uniref:Flagellar motor protein MotA n=1 Tax=Enterovirga aerilata TaxID=2730920 RepID=A0A849IEV1_9HYPH|nr:flagellar motor protein MotA [Enterovirga sp. DB1703]NNM74497.1 flagellar motor protein MotA [Enterovirga sp. DB1703]
MLHPTPLQHEARPLSSPRIYLVRMAVFLILVGFLGLILFEPLKKAFFGNPGLNALIGGILLVGIVLAGRQVIRLFREIRWVNHVSGADGRTLARPPVLLAPMAALIGDPTSRASLSIATARSLLDSISARLDESRELVRYLAGLLVFLGLLGTFWGLIETVNSVGRIIGSLRTGSDAAVLFDELKTSLSAPLAGMGISFSASLFGLAGSLILGFLDLQAGQAQSRFYTELEDWLATTTATSEAALSDPAVATQAMANLAEGIEGLVQSMRAEQKLLREWMEAQAARDRDLRAALERLVRERAH